MTQAKTQTDPIPATTERLRRWFRRAAVASLVANIGIIVTGGAVRLTDSGLGCPTWPRCTEASYTPHGELGLHGAIEFGNRLLTFVVAAVVIACWALALVMHRRARAANADAADRRPLVLSTLIALGVPLQAVIGGVTVLTDLNPYVVALHLLASMAIVGLCVWLIDLLRGPSRTAAPPALRRLAVAVFLVGWVVLWLGTVVTGSGPHSGDLESRRTGLDPRLMSHVHAWSVYALVALTVALIVLALRAERSGRSQQRPLLRAAVTLLAVELAQGLIGFVQYFTDLPELLVGLHMLGAGVTAAGIAWVLVRSRAR